MTVLGATIHIGFFALAVLWLLVTAEGSDGQDGDDGYRQVPDRSNSDNTAAGPDGSRPWPLTQSSSK